MYGVCKKYTQDLIYQSNIQNRLLLFISSNLSEHYKLNYPWPAGISSDKLNSNKYNAVCQCLCQWLAPLARGVTPMLAIQGCCNNFLGCGTAPRSVQDKHTQTLTSYNLFQKTPGNLAMSMYAYNGSKSIDSAGPITMRLIWRRSPNRFILSESECS